MTAGRGSTHVPDKCNRVVMAFDMLWRYVDGFFGEKKGLEGDVVDSAF
jgi:hypothetical protein